MTLAEALREIAIECAPRREEAVRLVYSADEFPDDAVSVLGDLVEQAHIHPHILGTAYFVDEWTGESTLCRMPSSIRKLYTNWNFTKPIWSFTDFVIWDMAPWMSFRRKIRKSHFIIPEYECLGDVELCTKIMWQCEAFSFVLDEIANAFMTRDTFSFSEVSAIASLSQVDGYVGSLDRLIPHVLDVAYENSDLSKHLSEIGVAHPSVETLRYRDEVRRKWQELTSGRRDQG